MPVITATQEVEIGRMVVQGQPMQRISEIPNMLALWYIPIIPATKRHSLRSTYSKIEPYLKNDLKQKKVGAMAHVVEPLSTKCKALS
jgi:hypothetical protein